MNKILPNEERRLRTLQVFSRYREYGGEEGSVYRIGDALQKICDVGFFLHSSEDVFSGGRFNKAVGSIKAVSNWSVLRQLRRYQGLGGYDCWLVHNVFPAMSPAVYSLAFKMGIPVIQYLHNYRFGCINGFFLNHGQPCQRCVAGNFIPALQTACWHGSHLQSGVMGGIMMRARGMDLFNRIADWIAISEAQKREHVLMGIPEERITVIPHFYESKEEVLPYPDQGDVLFIGRLSPEKGVDRLLKAWAMVQHLGRTLWIVGDGPEKPALEKMAASLGLKNVCFTGFLEHGEMAAIWQKTACIVVPSIWKESFGMVVLEAWARGRPVVAHRMGALPEIISHESDGLLVAPDDPHEMAEAILGILKNPALGEAMGRKGNERLKKDFGVAEWQQRIKEVLRKYSKKYVPSCS